MSTTTAEKNMLERLYVAMKEAGISESNMVKDQFIFDGLEDWAHETIKWWEPEFGKDDLNSAHAALAKDWDKVSFWDQTAELINEFSREVRYCKIGTY